MEFSNSGFRNQNPKGKGHMRYFMAIGICLIVGSVAARAAAEVNYVTDIMQITLRAGQGLDYKIIDYLKSGEEVEILERGDQWTMVRRLDGKEGWVLSRFLTTKIPNRMILENLEKENKVLSAQNESLVLENSELKKKTTKLETDLAQSREALQKVVDAYETLKEESEEFLKMKSSYTQSKKAQENMTQKMTQMEEDLKYLQTQHIFRWFLAGAGVLLLGFIIGLGARRSRRRPSLL